MRSTRYGPHSGPAAVAAVVLLLGWSGVAGAQMVEDQRQASLEIRAGAAIPGSDLADQFDPGFSAGLGIGFPFAERARLILGGDVGFLSEVVRDEELGTGEIRQFFEGDLRLWHYGGDLEVDLTDPDRSGVSFTLRGGLGATTIDPERIRTVVGGQEPVVTETESRTRFTANGGLGLGFPLSDGVDLLLGGKAYAIFMSEDDFEVEEAVEEQFENIWWSFPVHLVIRFRTP